MLITNSLVSNMSPRTSCDWVSKAVVPLLNVGLFLGLTKLQPVLRVLHQQLAGPLERIVLALRKSLPVFGHQNPAAIGMSGEVHAEHVPHFAFEPVRRG